MLNSTRKYTLIILCAVALMLGAFPSLGVKPSNFVANAQVESNPDLRRYEFVPDQVIYRTLFHTIFLLNQEASKAERVGQANAALAFRRAFKQDAELSDEQTVILNGIAAECEQAVRAVDAKARMIIEARRANYPDGKLRVGQQPLPPSPELAALQQERDMLILRYRDRLREAFGESEWQRFEQLVPPRVAAGIGTRRAQPRNAFVKASLKTTNTTVQTQAQSVITGSTLISYNAFSNIVTAVSTTELDFAAQDWYSGRVSGSIRDASGNVLASGNASDIDRDGTVSVTMQTTGQDQMTYSAQGQYSALVDIQDPALGGYYIDRFNYQNVYRGGEGGTNYYIYMPFYAFGPSQRTRLRSLYLGQTSPATVQAKPRIESSAPTVMPATVTITNSAASVESIVNATTAGLQEGDRAVVEVVKTSVNGSAVTFTPNSDGSSGQVQRVILTAGGSTAARFNISGVSSSGSYTFRVTVTDVERRNAQGVYQSVFNQVTVTSSNSTATLTVNP